MNSAQPRKAPPDSASQPRSVRRHCKIARLAPDLRERLNLMLRDGASYSSIIRSFREQGCPLDKACLSRWNAGGFQDWLREQAWLEEMRLRLDFASSVVNQKDTALLDRASLRVAVLRLYSLLIEFDPAVLSTKLAQSPGTYVRVLNALCQLVRSSAYLTPDGEEDAPPPPHPAPPNPLQN